MWAREKKHNKMEMRTECISKIKTNTLIPVSNLGSVDTGAIGVVREEQKHDFDKNQDSGPSFS